MKILRSMFCILSAFIYIQNAHALTIGFGDIYQQPSSVYLEQVDVTLLSGGTIAPRSDNQTTWFNGGNYIVSGGTVDTRILFDLGPTNISGGIFNGFTQIDRSQSVAISGGTFNGPLDIDRLGIGGTLDISGGIFNSPVSISRFQGDIIVRGGNFVGGFSGYHSFTNGALPTATFIGRNWSLNGAPLVFSSNNIFDLTGQSGVLSGNLIDGSNLAISIGGFFSPTHITAINAVPLPATLPLFVAGLGLLGFAMRRKVMSS